MRSLAFAEVCLELDLAQILLGAPGVTLLLADDALSVRFFDKSERSSNLMSFESLSDLAEYKCSLFSSGS